jgi:elongation factor Ts
MSITAADVNKLRQMTGAGMMDCKKALAEANGDFEEAVVVLRKKGQKISANRTDRAANEGAVIAMTSPSYHRGIIIELNCETDFVAKNDEFVGFAEEIAQYALGDKPADIDALRACKLSSGLSIAEKLDEYMAKIGERIQISRYEQMESDNIVAYIHAGNRLGVLVELNMPHSHANYVAGRDAAMQIAALNPVSVSEDDVPQNVKDRELEIGMDQARQEGKPEAMLDKIAQGKLQKFFKDNTLLAQEFVKDNSKTVGKMLDAAEKGLTIKRFIRVQLGQSPASQAVVEETQEA